MRVIFLQILRNKDVNTVEWQVAETLTKGSACGTWKIITKRFDFLA